ncbi:MAG: glycoside hydrolase family 3 N-terminal domain-containing protein [Ktedonobacterales bacterium]
MASRQARRVTSRVWGVMLLTALTLLLGACSGATSTTVRVHGVAPLVPTATLPPSSAGPQSAARLQQQARASAEWYLSRMSLDEQLGQMFLIETGWQDYNQDVANMVVGMHAGAMILYQQNMANSAQLKDYIATIQAHASLPLLVSIDEEGGVVDRLGALGFDPPLPAAQDLTASGNPHNAYVAGAQAAAELRALGINLNLAPVADVRTNPYAVEFTRIFGNSPKTVDAYAGAFMRGLQQNDVVACLKHWPGIGGVALDPHLTLPTMDETRAQLEATNFAAFRGLLAQDPGMIMVTHVIVPAIDPNMPATLSPKLVDGVLRGELGYQGVVMTDSLYMQGIAERYSLPEAAVLSVVAGDDLLEGAYDTGTMSAMLAALKAAIATGQISRARIDQSVLRILLLKQRFGLLALHTPPQAAGPVLAYNAALPPSASNADLPRVAA